jgi:hypothetical protein
MKILILSLTGILQSLTFHYLPIYENCGLRNNIDFITFIRAMARFKNAGTQDSIFTIIDMKKPSTDKRLFVIDVNRQQLLHSSHVAHGRASGELIAQKFSNKIGSHCTSTGLYRTAETYTGKNGYSLRLDGLDHGVNHNARVRGIVIHSSKYASPTLATKGSILGRSLGCPALPPEHSRQIIETIKNGTLLYIAN